jgi:hypothetical protein
MLGVPVWEHAGIICTGETYKAVVKMTFAKGAALEDPSHLFNASLEGNVRRAIDIHEGDKIDERALKALIRAAVALNTSKRAAARGHDDLRTPNNLAPDSRPGFFIGACDQYLPATTFCSCSPNFSMQARATPSFVNSGTWNVAA